MIVRYTTDQSDKTSQERQPLEKTNKSMAKSKQEEKTTKGNNKGKIKQSHGNIKVITTINHHDPKVHYKPSG